MSEIASKVQKIIVDKLGVEESEVVATASFTNDLGADSLDTVELIRTSGGVPAPVISSSLARSSSRTVARSLKRGFAPRPAHPHSQ